MHFDNVIHCVCTSHVRGRIVSLKRQISEKKCWWKKCSSCTRYILMIFALGICISILGQFSLRWHRPLVYSCLSQLLLNEKTRDPNEGEKGRTEEPFFWVVSCIEEHQASLSLMLPKCRKRKVFAYRTNKHMTSYRKESFRRKILKCRRSRGVDQVAKLDREKILRILRCSSTNYHKKQPSGIFVSAVTLKFFAKNYF